MGQKLSTDQIQTDKNIRSNKKQIFVETIIAKQSEEVLRVLSEKRCNKIHDIVESSEINFFVSDLKEMDEELLKILQKSLFLPNGWSSLLDVEESASLFRTHIYKNGKMGVVDVFKKEVNDLDLETAWDLYLFFYPTAERNQGFFDIVKDYDAFLQSWKWRHHLVMFNDKYKNRVDLPHCFGNVALVLKKNILTNKEYYLKNKYLSQMLILNQDKKNCFSIIQKDVILMINKYLL